MPASFTGHFCQIVNIAKSKVNPVYIFRGLSHRRRVLNVNTLVYDMAVSYTSAQCSALTGSASDAMGFWAFPQLLLRALARSFLHCPVLSNIYCISSLPHRVLPAIHSAAQPCTFRHLQCSPAAPSSNLHQAVPPSTVQPNRPSSNLHPAVPPFTVHTSHTLHLLYPPDFPAFPVPILCC